MKPIYYAAILGFALVSSPALAQSADPSTIASSDDVKAQVAAMEAEMKPGQTFLWKPLLRGGKAIAAIEIWKAEGPPAVHVSEAEYTMVIAGAGTLESGGTLVEPRSANPGLLLGTSIEGGTSRPIHVGDILMIPAGTPHTFDVTGGEVVLLGVKVPEPAP